MQLLCAPVNIHPLELISHVHHQLVDHGFVLALLPGFELFLLPNALNVNDEIFSVNFKVDQVLRGASNGVHVLAALVGIDIAEGLSGTDDFDLHLLNRLLMKL